MSAVWSADAMVTFNRDRVIAEGGTYYGSDNPLVERMEFIPTRVSQVTIESPGLSERLRVVEGETPAPGVQRMVIEGVFQRSDAVNANKRIYPRSIWERILSEGGPVQKRIVERRMIGHLEHPETGTTDLNRGAILVLEARLQEDGTVVGKALVYDTPEGKRIQEYIITGTQIGISSRGTGTVDNRGMVQEDYQLDTWDVVYNPSTTGAHPTLSNPPTAGRKTEAVSESTETTTGKANMDPKEIARVISESEAKVQQATSFDPAILGVEERVAKSADLLVERVSVKAALEAVGAHDVAAKLVADIDALRTKLGENIMLPPSAQPAAAALGTKDLSTIALGLAWLMKEAAVTNVTVMDAKLHQALIIYGTRLAGAHYQVGTATGAPVPGPGSVSGPKTEDARNQEALALLKEARDHVKTLTEEQETSQATLESLQAVNDDAARALSTAVAVLRDLSGVNLAKQVRETVERIVSGDKRLVPFRETLLQVKNPVAVEAKAAEIVKTIEEQAARPDVTALAPRIKRRAANESALPSPGSKPASREDASHPSTEPKPQLQEKQAAALSALRKALPRVRESINAQ